MGGDRGGTQGGRVGSDCESIDIPDDEHEKPTACHDTRPHCVCVCTEMCSFRVANRKAQQQQSLKGEGVQ